MDYYTLWTHQIKTPIAAMRLLLQEEETHTGELEQELFKIEQYADMALQYQRLESLSSDLQLESCSLDGILRQALKKMATPFIRRRISLEFDGTGATVLTDEKWLTFVVEQLLSNALKYTPPGGRITLYLEADKTLVVEDNGIGIRAEDIPRIFERGFTGFNGRMDKKSTGIGPVPLPADPLPPVPHHCHRVPTGRGHAGAGGAGLPRRSSCSDRIVRLRTGL